MPTRNCITCAQQGDNVIKLGQVQRGCWYCKTHYDSHGYKRTWMESFVDFMELPEEKRYTMDRAAAIKRVKKTKN